ncbi:hypothetical protein GGR34_003674 [Microvirga flocculans]|uniref:Uncharacterized protein n=1 Tax=Microvirga flocculans TaxID=217168 RepID=A0A7W6II95_9HYPH|nr:hypothetical protein [Microvirga flocculans]MBB4041989.1 hypothetical protein [Microvirga flocculans]
MTEKRYLSMAEFMEDRFGPKAVPVERMGTKRCRELRDRGCTLVRHRDWEKARAEYHALQGDPAYAPMTTLQQLRAAAMRQGAEIALDGKGGLVLKVSGA